jgi:hypothetical protein
VDKILGTFLLAYRMTPNATLPQQHCPAELFFGRKPRTTLDLLLPTKQPTGHRDTKMECHFKRRHGAVERNFDGGDPVYVRYRQSHDWMAGSVTKRIRGHFYNVTLANGSTHRFHANQMRLRSTQRMMISQHSQTPSTCPFNARRLPPEKPDTWTSMQGTRTNTLATRRIQRWTTSSQSSQAAHCWNPDVLNEVTSLRNNLSWTLLGNHTSTHKSGPNGTSSFCFSPWVLLLKRGGVGTLG